MGTQVEGLKEKQAPRSPALPKKKVGPAASPAWGRAERRTGSRLPAGTGACPQLPDAAASTGARKPREENSGWYAWVGTEWAMPRGTPQPGASR